MTVRKQFTYKNRTFHVDVETDTGIPDPHGIFIHQPIWYTVSTYDDRNYFIKSRVTGEHLFRTIQMQEEITKSILDKDSGLTPVDVALNCLGFKKV